MNDKSPRSKAALPFGRRLLLAAAGLLLGRPAAAQLDLRLVDSAGNPHLEAGAEVLLNATLPVGSGSGLNSELPAIYIDAFRGQADLSESACQARLQGFARSLSFNAPTLDLLAYQLATLSAEGVLTVLDPRGGFGSSRMLERLELGTAPGPLVYDDERRQIWISLPGRRSLVIVDTGSWDILREIPLGGEAQELGLASREAGAPQIWARVILSPPSSPSNPSECRGGPPCPPSVLHTWDRPENEAERLVLPAGTTRVLFAGSRLFVVASGRLFLHQPEQGWLQLAHPAAQIAHSTAAEALVVLTPGGELLLLELDGESRGTLPAAREGDNRLTLSPDGRWAFAWSPQHDDLRVADLARQTWRGELRFRAPSELGFSDRYLYARSSQLAEVLVTPLSSLDAPGLVAGKLVAGGTRPHPVPQEASLRSFPGGETVFWASAEDRQIFVYHEGMNAASGSLQNPKSTPVDLLLPAPLLREKSPGAFEARFRLPRPGKYLVAAGSRQPLAVACRLIEVRGKNGEIANPARLAAFEMPPEWPALQGFSLRFELEDPGQPLPEQLPVVVMSPAGTWQRRVFAQKSAGSQFSAEITIPNPGPHFVIVRYVPADGRPLQRRLKIEILPPAVAAKGAP